MEAGYAVGSIIRLMRRWKLLIKLKSPDASSGFDDTGVYQARSSFSTQKVAQTASRYANDLRACRRSLKIIRATFSNVKQVRVGWLTVWVQSRGRLGWREYSARDHREASRSTAGATGAAIARRAGCGRLSIAHLLLSIWLMTKSWSFALRECPESCSMTDWLTPLTIHPFGRRYSRLYLHPLHLRLLLEGKKNKKLMSYGIETGD